MAKARPKHPAPPDKVTPEAIAAAVRSWYAKAPPEFRALIDATPYRGDAQGEGP